MYRFLLLTPLLLAACATPREQCVSAATKDLQTVEFLIAETQANLSRGYAFETDYEIRSSIDVCAGGWDPMRFCTRTYTVPRNRPIAIDPALETKKLNTLKTQQADLKRRAAPAVQACQKQYPAS